MTQQLLQHNSPGNNPVKVERAVFIAAGTGSRLAPITNNIPKPLVVVNGVRIIDTLLDAVYAAGIKEIYIVRGYLAEQFDQLKVQYPSIQFLENKMYNKENNISSLYQARHLLQNSYIIDADFYLTNPSLIMEYQTTTNYLGIPTDATDDWCFITKDGIITRAQIGGKNCHRFIGISYWSHADGAKMESHIEQVYNMPGGKDCFWDQAALEYFKDDYSIKIRECKMDDVHEIDTLEDLQRLDETYL